MRACRSRSAASCPRSSCRVRQACRHSSSRVPLPAKWSSTESWKRASVSSRLLCWEWMSTRRAATSCSRPTGTGQSLMKQRERPDRDTTRRISSRSPSCSTSAPESSASRASSRPVKPASTTQESAPSVSRDASALAPASRDRAPSRMDLPAPVWPVIMTRPSGNSISRASINM